jgi:hypothetical protein
MKLKHRLAAMAGLALLTLAPVAHADRNDGYGDDDIYLGETDNDTIQRCDIQRGNCQTFVQKGAGALVGSRGMFFSDGRLLVVNQNVDTPFNGEVQSYDTRSGEFEGKIVATGDKNPPFAPRGMVRGPGNVLYVAEFGTETGPCSNGHIRKYNGYTHQWIADLDITGFAPDFHPRGIVFGPDGYLYVTAIGCPYSVGATYDPEAGYVLRFDPRTDKFDKVISSFDKIIATNNSKTPQLHRPEAIVFDRNGFIWVTSFRQDASNKSQVDVLLRIDKNTGMQKGFIPLGRPEADDWQHYRTSAQAITIGPNGDIFAPISRGPTVLKSGTYTISPVHGKGELWRCSPVSGRCSNIVRSGQLTAPWYAIFRFNDPATLEYIQY